ncbi:hypothetical protein IW262DRAFT_1302257 [Armillaria fumosa]|nr:hypothetical protein IW262DRAFT_1302257 [Armillaria fumosa]
MEDREVPVSEIHTWTYTLRGRRWYNVAIVPSHMPPVHPQAFDSHRRVFSFFDGEPYTPEKPQTTKRDDRTQHHRAGRDELTNTIYINMTPAGLTTAMPRPSYPPPRPVHWQQAYEATSPTSQPPIPAFAAGYPG